MPVIPCTKDGKSGFMVKNGNKCFTGPGAKKQAEKQLQAIKISQKKRGQAVKFNLEEFYKNITVKELADILSYANDLTITEKATIIIDKKHYDKN